MLLWRAKTATANTIGTLSARHDALEKELDTDKSKAGASADGTALSPAARLAWSDNDADAVINATKDRAARQKKLAGLDKRIDDEKELDGIYDKWIDLVQTEQEVGCESIAERDRDHPRNLAPGVVFRSVGREFAGADEAGSPAGRDAARK